MKFSLYSNFFKPVGDKIVAFILLVLLFPIFILVSILILIDSKGPVFFLQERLGKDGMVFKLIKFRSMTHRERSYTKQTLISDPEVTNVGVLIRRLKIDELPQLINVLIGQMSIVGPRPSLPNLREKFNEDADYRIQVKPGVTNLAAVNGSIYLTWPERWVYDRYYVENLTFGLDLFIIMKTILVVFLGEKFFYKGNGNKTY